MHPMGRKREAFVLESSFSLFFFLVFLGFFLVGGFSLLPISLCLVFCLFICCKFEERGKVLKEWRGD